MCNEKKIDIFTPYYINQNRLFDLYSILNGGYSEYEEVSFSNSSSIKSGGKAGLSAGASGFKLIKISGSGEGYRENQNEKSSGITTKKVQTVTSILGSVLDKMRKDQYIKLVDDVSIGDYVEINVHFKLNSVKYIIQQLQSILDMFVFAKTLGVQANFPYDKKQIDNISKTMTSMFDTLEVFCERDEYAVLTNLKESDLYLSQIHDVVDTEIQCFCQIKNIYLEGTKLLKNTTFSKIKNDDARNKFTDAIDGLSSNNIIDMGTRVLTEIKDKKVYEVEIISLSK